MSKAEWLHIGKVAGWMRTSQIIPDDGFADGGEPYTDEEMDLIEADKVKKILQDIRSGKDPYFGLSHFHESNMSDYSMMSETIRDMTSVYGIDETNAMSIIQTLTHSD